MIRQADGLQILTIDKSFRLDPDTSFRDLQRFHIDSRKRQCADFFHAVRKFQLLYGNTQIECRISDHFYMLRKLDLRKRHTGIKRRVTDTLQFLRQSNLLKVHTSAECRIPDALHAASQNGIFQRGAPVKRILREIGHISVNRDISQTAVGKCCIPEDLQTFRQDDFL